MVEVNNVNEVRSRVEICTRRRERAFQCFTATMKTTVMEELDDDLAAEEENKIINEVRYALYRVQLRNSRLPRNTKPGERPTFSRLRCI